MENGVAEDAVRNSWQIVPSNTFAAIILIALFFYLFMRHAILCIMIFDWILGWLREFNWFPKPGNRGRIVVHWLIALGLFLAFLLIAGNTGWLTFVPK